MLFKQLGITLDLINHSVTLDELLDIWGYGVMTNSEIYCDEDIGQIYNLDTGEGTGVWYNDLEQEWNSGILYAKEN